MRLLAELAVVAAVIAFGWNKSFSERAGMAASPTRAKAAATATATPRSAAVPATAAPKSAAAPVATNAAQSPTPDNSWMWDPNRKASLDRKPSPQPRP